MVQYLARVQRQSLSDSWPQNRAQFEIASICTDSVSMPPEAAQ